MRLTPILRSHKAKFPADFSTNGNWPYRCNASAWRNGRRASLRSWCPKGRGGSNPLADTTTGFKILNLHRLDVVRRAEAEDLRQKEELSLHRPADRRVLAEAVLLALKGHVRIWQLLLLAHRDERLRLARGDDLVLEALEQDDRAAEPVGEVDRGTVEVDVATFGIGAEQGVAVVGLELVRLLDEQLEGTDPVVARARVVEIAPGHW